MSPFNLDAALEGQPVVTREGKSVRQLTLFIADREAWPLAGIVDEVVQLFTLQGKSGEDHKAMPHDLFMCERRLRSPESTSEGSQPQDNRARP